MYVRELEEGCLLKPNDGWTWRMTAIRDIALDHSQKQGMIELEDSNIYHSITMVSTRARHLGFENPGNPAIYLGKHKTAAYFYGLKTHHVVVVDGIPAVMDGYTFRDVQKV